MLRYLLYVALAALILFLLGMMSGCGFGLGARVAHATWKPEYGQQPKAVQEWFQSAEVNGGYNGPAFNRLGVVMCCEQAERLKTKFLATRNGDWAYYPDPDCTHDGCELLPIPPDVVHDDPIHAFNPADDDLPEFRQMRVEGVLFIWNGKPTCFWPPKGSG